MCLLAAASVKGCCQRPTPASGSVSILYSGRQASWAGESIGNPKSSQRRYVWGRQAGTTQHQGRPGFCTRVGKRHGLARHWTSLKLSLRCCIWCQRLDNRDYRVLVQEYMQEYMHFCPVIAKTSPTLHQGRSGFCARVGKRHGRARH